MKNVLKWLAVAIFLLTALSSLMLGQFVSFCIFLIGAAVCAPPSLAFIEREIGFSLQSWHKYSLAGLCLLLGSAFMKPQVPKTKIAEEQRLKPQTDTSVQQSQPVVDTISTATMIQKELDFIAKEFDESKFRGSIEAAQGELAMFFIWKGQIERGQKDSDPKAQKLAARLKQAVVNLQVRDFPKLRKEYAQSLHSKTWEHDVDVKAVGKGNTILQLTGYHFAANRNIKEMHEILSVTPFEFRFKQVQYRWYDGAGEYQYFDVNPLSDSELVELSR